MTRFAEVLDTAMSRMSGVELVKLVDELSYRQRLRLSAALREAEQNPEVRHARRVESGRRGGQKIHQIRVMAGTLREHQQRAAAARWGVNNYSTEVK